MATASCAHGDGTTALCMSEFLSVQVSQTVTVEGGLLRQPFPLPVLQLRDQLYAPVEMSDWMCKVPHWRVVYCAMLCVLRCLGAAALYPMLLDREDVTLHILGNGQECLVAGDNAAGDGESLKLKHGGLPPVAIWPPLHRD